MSRRLEHHDRADRARRDRRRRLPRLDEGDPAALALRGQGGVRDLQQPAHRLAGADRGRRGRQGHRRRARRPRRRDRDDADRRQGPPGARRRDGQDPAADLPRGQLLRRPDGRLAVGPRARRRRHDPGPADRHAGPARRGADRAAVRHARGPQGPAARVRHGARGRRRPRLQPLAPVLGARLPRLGDRRRGDARRDRPRPLRLRRARRRHRQGARPQPRAAQVADHRLPHHRGGLRAPGGQPARRRRRAAEHAARLDARARRAQRVVPAAALAGERAAAGRAELRGDARRLAAVRARAARPRVRARAARPGRRPAADRARPRGADRPQHPALPPGPPRRELPEHGHPPVVDGHGAGQAVPGPGQGLRGGAQAAARASPARAARATPTARGSACWPPAARTS